MSIILGKYTGENNVVNKSFSQQHTISSYTLLDDCDILNPTICVDVNGWDFSTYNYMYISEFHRYYYINGISLNNAVAQITGRVDVLKSYASQIRASKAIAKRCNIENRYIQDDAYMIQSNRKWEYKNFPYSLNSNLQNVLIVAGGGE